MTSRTLASSRGVMRRSSVGDSGSALAGGPALDDSMRLSGSRRLTMRIVFPDGAGCVHHPSDLDPLKELGEVDFHDGPPSTREELLARLRPADAVILDYSVLE